MAVTPARARVSPRAVATSDLTRVGDASRAVAVAAIVLAVGLGVSAASERGRGELAAPGPLARPHALANVACTSCHVGEVTQVDTSTKGVAVTCAACHDARAHASTRTAHRALAAAGKLSCATCHGAHGGAQGVTFAGAADGAFVRWGNGAERAGSMSARPSAATVPLVPVVACASCHDMGNARDPAAACPIGADASGAHAVSGCFDEHRRVDAVARATTTHDVCAAQHSPARFVAWDAARAAVAQSSWVSSAPSTSAQLRAFGPALLAILAGGAALVLAPRRRRAAALSPLVAPPAVVPPARVLLPQINATTCVGCYACVDACPFDVLEVRAFVAEVVRPTECCGVVSCAQVCPNGSLRITEGEPVATRPRLDASLESLDAKGVFVAGDLSGLPLIKNAIRQGARAVEAIAAGLSESARTKRAADFARVDLVIVGAGPAGISAALAAEARGLSYVVFEQGTVAASIKSFPRQKLVFDQPIDLPLEGELWLRESTKEDLLAQWSRIVRARNLRILEHHRVDAIDRDAASLLTVRAVAATGEPVTVTAARLVLAIGKRGSPRMLDADVTIAPDASNVVSYALADARSYEGKRVLVVGLGDVAMEAAIALARQPGAEVTVSYRGPEFARGKARNIAEMRALEAKGALRILWESVPTSIAAGRVTLSIAPPSGGPRESITIANDAVFVLIGGVPSWDLVARAGVRLASEGMPVASREENRPAVRRT